MDVCESGVCVRCVFGCMCGAWCACRGLFVWYANAATPQGLVHPQTRTRARTHNTHTRTHALTYAQMYTRTHTCTSTHLSPVEAKTNVIDTLLQCYTIAYEHATSSHMHMHTHTHTHIDTKHDTHTLSVTETHT